ncbi:hypothetical protein TNCV_3911861 [Trichonephila clavipes]|nr:hypothetical protein TNCV_3911861 [Trichonephila clavipes]
MNAQSGRSKAGQSGCSKEPRSESAGKNYREMENGSENDEDSRFGRCGDMTSIANWSDKTDSSSPPSNSSTGLGASSPSRVTTGDDYIAEKSDIFREAISARNVYAAWARKMTNARPNDPKLQEYHLEVTKAGETVNSLLKQLDVPLFKIPASEKELDKILLRLKSKANDPRSEDPRREKGSGSSSTPASPRKVKKAAKRSVDSDGFAPRSSLLGKLALPVRPLHPPQPLLPRLLWKTRVWKDRMRIWN